LPGAARLRQDVATTVQSPAIPHPSGHLDSALPGALAVPVSLDVVLSTWQILLHFSRIRLPTYFPFIEFQTGCEHI
jgi:hypothetical protein